MDNLPFDLLLMIFLKCDPFERKLLSLVNKQFNSVYKDLKLDYIFHIQGNTVKLFESGLKTLSVTKYMEYQTLKISRFDLDEVFDKHYEEGQLFGKALPEYANPTINELIIEECVVTGTSLRRLLLVLYPGVRSLTIFRCILTLNPKPILQSSENIPYQNGQTDLAEMTDPTPIVCAASGEGARQQHITNMTLSNPLYSDLDGESLFDWINNTYCAPGCLYVFEDSKVSAKRSVWRRFSKSYKMRELREVDARNFFDVLREANTNPNQRPGTKAKTIRTESNITRQI